jgi:integrase
MKLLYFATPEITDKFTDAIEKAPLDSNKVHFWLDKPQGKSSHVFGIYPEDLVYDDDTKTFVKNGLNSFRISDKDAVAKYAALPIQEFLRWWNDIEYTKLNTKREAQLDLSVTEQRTKNLADIDSQIAMFDEWYHVNSFDVPTVTRQMRSEPAVAPAVASPSTTVPEVLLSEFVADHLKAVKTNHSGKTYDIAQRSFSNFKAAVGDKPIHQISAQDLESFKTLRASQVSIASVNMEVRAIKAGFNVAVDWSKLDKSPFAKTKQLKVQKKKKVHLTKTEYQKLIAKVTAQWMKDIVEFDVLTGLRLGELMNLKWTDVDLAKKTANIQSSDDYQVKGGNMREIPLNDRAIEIINSKKHVNEWIFLSDKYKKVTDDFVSKTFKVYVRAAKLSDDLHFHSLRHTFGTWAAEAGVPLHTVKNIMGHSSVTVTEGYVGADQTAMQSEIGKVKTD